MRCWAAMPRNATPPIRDRLDATRMLGRLLARKELSIGTFGTDGQWGEIDNPGDVVLYQKYDKGGELLLEDAYPTESRRQDDHD